jgi:NTP pyrophosphatase (non-canonical NTP hydrolase)
VSDGLVDLLDSLVDTGVAAGGDVTISVAGVDLIALRLKALLASVGTEGADDLEFPRRERRERRAQLPARVDADENSLQRGLAQLVLVLVEILGELLERQAVRRMDAGSLNDDETEKLGAAFLALNRRIDELYDELLPPVAQRSLV